MIDYQNKKILVTGAGGFVARHLVERLVDAGADVCALVWEHLRDEDNLLYRELAPEKLSRVRRVKGDLSDAVLLGDLLRDSNILFHLAATTSVPDSFRDPGKVFHTNFDGTLNLLLVAKELALQRVVTVSTAAVYGPPRYLPIDEGHPLDPRSPYAASKAAADQAALGFYHSFDLPVVVLRLFNTFGPGQSDRAVIPGIISQVLAGDDVRLGNVDSARDFNYIANVVDGFMAAGIASDAVGHVVNLGSGISYTVAEVVEKIAALVGKELRVIVEEGRKRSARSDGDRLTASIELARRLLGYRPALTFDRGLELTLAYYADRRAQYAPS